MNIDIHPARVRKLYTQNGFERDDVLFYLRMVLCPINDLAIRGPKTMVSRVGKKNLPKTAIADG
jgi:hypothetical protein